MSYSRKALLVRFGVSFIIAIIFSGSIAFSQNKVPFDLPAEISVPSWVTSADWAHPNVYRIDSLIEVYNATSDESERVDGEDGFHEDPYLNAYIRWRNEMMPFVNADGSISYNPNRNKELLLRSIAESNIRQDPNYQSRTTSAASWSVLGPVQTYKVGTGELKNYQSNIYAIAAAPSNPNVLYAGSEPGTLYRSSDKGMHWASITESLSNCTAKSIVVDPTNENIVYTYDGSANVLLKTATGGLTWTPLTGYTGGGGNSMVISPTTGRVFITGNTAIYYSDNFGLTWFVSPGSTVTGKLYDMAINPADANTIYAVGSTTTDGLVLLRSVDGGANFSNVTGGLSSTDTKGARLAVTPANSNVIYCVNLGNTTPPKMIKSTDGGSTWSVTVSSTATGLGGTSATTGLGMSNGQGYYDLGIVASPSDANAVIVGTTTTYKSTDGGLNFSPVGGYSGPIGIHPDLQWALAIGGDTYLATDGGVNHSSDFFTNAANWSVRNNGIRSADYWGFGQGWDEDIVVGGRYHNGNGALYDLFGAGNALSLGGGEDATGHVFHGHNGVVGFRDIGMRVLPGTLTGAVENGAPDAPNSMWPQDDYYGKFSSELVSDPRYSNVFYLGKDSILWKSVNAGSSYTSLHNFGSGNKVWRFEIARSQPDVIYVCTNSGLYVTTDGGSTWSALSLPVAWSYYNTDVAVNPKDENEVYVCMANGPAASKVFKSTDGGGSWTNITGSALNGEKVAFLQFQGGTNGGVYAVTNVKPSKLYYRDATMSDWIDFSDNLPQSLSARVGALIFYRDSKIRLAGNCSVWESPLYSVGSPVAQPMADRKYVGCARDTIHFFDYSMTDYAGTTRAWSFPGALYVSSTTDLRPSVVYPGAGTYDVSLSVSRGGVTDSKTITGMIVVDDTHCGPDTVAGKCIQLNGITQTVNLGVANINSNTFSISCWIQPEGVQKSFSQIVSHGKYPGSGSGGFGLGFKFNGYTPNLILCYTDSLISYHGTSSLVCDSTKWNYVVLTYSPTGVVLYLNGIADTVNTDAMPAIDLSQSPFMLNLDCHNGQGSKFKGKIDEVKFFDYTLSQEEVREKMHLITDPATETGLIKYFQFNQYYAPGGRIYDMKNNFNSFVPEANVVASSAPVSSGRMFRMPSVNSGGLKSFTDANLNIHLPTSGVYPDGEVVAFHLFSNPDVAPDTRPTVPGYFIVNNYGANQSFAAPDSTVMGGLNILFSDYLAGDFRLFKRATGDFGNTWGSELTAATTFSYAPADCHLTWVSGSYDSAYNAQYVVVNNDTTSHIVSISGQENAALAISDFYPNPCKGWSKIDIDLGKTPSSEASVTITDIAGKKVTGFSERLRGGVNTIMVNLQGLTQGIYVVSIDIDGVQSVTRKLVKM